MFPLCYPADLICAAWDILCRNVSGKMDSPTLFQHDTLYFTAAYYCIFCWGGGR